MPDDSKTTALTPEGWRQVKPAPSTLKSCPFCGGAAEMDTQRAYCALSTGNLGSGVAIYCTRCSADMMHCYEDHRGTDREALWADLTEAWNRRAA